MYRCVSNVLALVPNVSHCTSNLLTLMSKVSHCTPKMLWLVTVQNSYQSPNRTYGCDNGDVLFRHYRLVLNAEGNFCVRREVGNDVSFVSPNHVYVLELDGVVAVAK